MLPDEKWSNTASERSAARLAHRSGGPGVGSSNLPAPTIFPLNIKAWQGPLSPTDWQKGNERDPRVPRMSQAMLLSRSPRVADQRHRASTPSRHQQERTERACRKGHRHQRQEARQLRHRKRDGLSPASSGDRGWTRHAHFENGLALLRAGDREIDARCNGVRANRTTCTRHSKGIGDDSDPELRICVFDGSA